jgi:hypothetical protein
MNIALRNRFRRRWWLLAVALAARLIVLGDPRTS